jgi:hypothetical protein
MGAVRRRQRFAAWLVGAERADDVAIITMLMMPLDDKNRDNNQA